MKPKKIKIVITCVLLLYFLCYIVPPVSSIIPSADSFADTKGTAIMGKNTVRERMYLFDLTLWEILKRTRSSDSLTALLPQGSEDFHQRFTGHSISFVENDPAMLPYLAERNSPIQKDSNLHPAGFPIAHSGLSPPVLI